MASSTSKRDGKFISTVYSNTQSNLIEITEDKLENTIMKFIEKYVKANSWLTPLSLLISILIMMLTSEVNKSLFGISKEIWTAIFIILSVVSAFWFIISIVNHFRFRKETKIESLICKIKNVTGWNKYAYNQQLKATALNIAAFG